MIFTMHPRNVSIRSQEAFSFETSQESLFKVFLTFTRKLRGFHKDPGDARVLERFQTGSQNSFMAVISIKDNQNITL